MSVLLISFEMRKSDHTVTLTSQASGVNPGVENGENAEIKCDAGHDEDSIP